MQVGIIADTHLKSCSDKLEQLASQLSKTNLLIHAGDYGSYEIMEYFKNHFNFVGVWGNADDALTRSHLKEKEIIIIEPFRIGVFHGHGESKTTQLRAFEAFSEQSVNIIIFGHSHQPSIFTKNKVLMLNPGSAFNKRQEHWFSYILLTIDHSSLNASLILNDK